MDDRLVIWMDGQLADGWSETGRRELVYSGGQTGERMMMSRKVAVDEGVEVQRWTEYGEKGILNGVYGDLTAIIEAKLISMTGQSRGVKSVGVTGRGGGHMTPLPGRMRAG